VRRSRIAAAVVTVVLAPLLACGPPEPEFRGSIYDNPIPAEDFTLTDQYGETFRLGDHRGKIVVLFFGYAHCPDVCPVTLSTWSRVEEALPDDAEVEFVFITVDPERDSGERIGEHLRIFSEDFIGLRGSQDELDTIFKQYGVFSKKVAFSSSAIGYVVDHTTVMLVIDREGMLRGTFPFDASADDIVHDLRRLLDS
jgi:protein SCO1/2